MRAGAGQFKNKHILEELVDEEPIRLNMAFAASTVIAYEWMVVAFVREGLSVGKHLDDRVKRGNVQPSFLSKLVVLFEARCELDFVLHEFSALRRLSISL